MADKNKAKIMSLSLELDMQDLIKNSAKKAGCTVSKLMRDLVEKHLSLLVNDGEEIPVIVKIPLHLKGDEVELRKWLLVKTDALVKALCA